MAHRSVQLPSGHHVQGAQTWRSMSPCDSRMCHESLSGCAQTLNGRCDGRSFPKYHRLLFDRSALHLRSTGRFQRRMSGHHRKTYDFLALSPQKLGRKGVRSTGQIGRQQPLKMLAVQSAVHLLGALGDRPRASQRNRGSYPLLVQIRTADRLPPYI